MRHYSRLWWTSRYRRSALRNLAPEELRRRQLAALLAWVMAGGRAQPIVLAIEDLHRADPTTLDVIRSIAERGALAPLLVLATTRPEFRAPWDMRSHHGVISLAPLDRRQVARMVGELAAKHALSQDIVDGVSERTGGVPLFVEEVTRLLLDGGNSNQLRRGDGVVPRFRGRGDEGGVCARQGIRHGCCRRQGARRHPLWPLGRRRVARRDGRGEGGGETFVREMKGGVRPRVSPPPTDVWA